MESVFKGICPNGREVELCLPFSANNLGTCQTVFKGKEYPFLPFLNPRVIVDVGGNVGAAAVLFAGSYPMATVYSMEPGSIPFSFLKRNAASMPNIRTFNVGAFDRDMNATLHLGDFDSVTNSLVVGHQTGKATETVSLRELRAFLSEQNIQHIDIFKIDTEGAELPIFHNILPMLSQINCVMFEYHSERDRVAIDRLLNELFCLYSAGAEQPHRGTQCWVQKRALAAANLNAFEVQPVTL